ncbi:armadillo-type protein [Phlyctochytrium arcticum]|nr:armadillo-type protein [Phlyctochytrium arcticum]
MMGDSPMEVSDNPETLITTSPQSRAAADEVLQVVQRDVNILVDPASDRLAKRKALERIQKETVGKSSVIADKAQTRLIFHSLCKPLVRCLADSVERCRESSTNLLISFTNNVDNVTPFLAYIIPALSLRLAQNEIIEPSEEIRLLQVQALVRLAEVSGAGYAQFVEETVKILQKSLLDPFPDVKKESSKLVSVLCASCPRAVAFHGATVAKAIIPCLQHRHSSVRTAGLQAVKDAVLVDASGLDDVLEPLRQLTLDKSPSVREALYIIAGEWLLKLPDRWSLAHKVLPLLLAGLTDELSKNQEICKTYMDQIGALYEYDWEDRVKNDLDYTSMDANRPRVGCRHLARENIQKIVQKMLDGMSNWNIEIRTKSAQVLAIFISYTETLITGYIDIILPVMNRVQAGDEAIVCSQASRVAELLGHFVQPQIYLSIMLPAIRNGGGGSTSFRIGCLKTMRDLVHGTAPGAFDKNTIEQIAELLLERELSQNEDTEVLAYVAALAAEVVQHLKAPHPEAANSGGLVSDKAAFDLFLAIVHLGSVPMNDKIPGVPLLRQKGNEAMDGLVVAYNVGSAAEIYALHFEGIAKEWAASQSTWTRHSPELRFFRAVMMNAGPLSGHRLELLMPTLIALADPSRESELRESLFDLLLQLLAIPNANLNAHQQLHMYSAPLLNNVIIPNAIWKPGRHLSILRGKSIKVLLALLQATPSPPECVGLLTKESLAGKWDPDLLNVLVSTMEETSEETRGDSLRVLNLILLSLHLDAQSYKTVYQELLKRLDDAQDAIRILTAQTWKSFFYSLKTWNTRMTSLRQQAGDSSSVLIDPNGHVVESGGELIELRLDDVHWIAMIKGLVVHMDDPNPHLQESIFETINSSIGIIPSNLLRDHLSSVRTRHRTPTYIDRLLGAIPSI